MNPNLPCLDRLPATRSCPVRGLEYRPWSRTAIVTDGRTKSRKYAIDELPTRVGRAFRCTKADGTHHNCRLDPEGNHECDCRGFESRATERADARHGNRMSDTLGCVHLDMAEAIDRNGWLPRLDAHRADDAGEDVGETETPGIPDSELPECFRGLDGPWAGVPF